MRTAIVVLALLAPAIANAAMMEHFDLAGLVLRSDTIVVAERTPGAKLSHFKIVTTLRGKPPGDLDLDDSLYELPPTMDSRVIVFLTHRDNQPFIVGSGLRITDHGKAFRFEQWNNPGGWTKVPQGADPQGQWRPTPQLDRPGLDAAVGSAIKRVEALEAAKQLRETDKRRAALLALLPAAGLPGDMLGFYVDVYTGEIETALAAIDTAAAVSAESHDHTAPWLRQSYAKPNRLYDIAKDPTIRAEFRALAVAAIARDPSYVTDPDMVRNVIALINNSDPAVRAAAVVAAARPAGAMSSDPKQDKLIRTVASEARTAITKLYQTETDNDVIEAIIDTFQGAFRTKLPARNNPPPIAGAILEVRDPMIVVSMVCTTPTARVTKPTLVATQAGKPVPLSYEIRVRCSDHSDGGNSATASLPTGTFELALDATVAGKHVALPLGTLTHDASGETHR